jgi:hypothetical protein
MVNLMQICNSAEIFKHVIIANDVNLRTLDPDMVLVRAALKKLKTS